MKRIFGVDCILVSESSRLWDYAGNREKIFAKIQREYGVDVSGVRDGRLVDVIKEISRSRLCGHGADLKSQ